MTQAVLRLVVIGALAAAAVWGGFRVYSLSHPRPIAADRVPVGTASPPSPGDLVSAESAMPAVKIPDHLPSFSLNDLSGAPQSSAAWTGRPLVLNFWATWCAPCRREIPLLNTLSQEWSGQQLAVIGIAVDQPDKVRRFVGDFKVGYPMLVGEQDALDLTFQLGVAAPAFPFSVFVDRHGEIVTLFVGELHRPQATLILSLLKNLDAGTLELSQARLRIAAGLSQLGQSAPAG